MTDSKIEEYSEEDDLDFFYNTRLTSKSIEQIDEEISLMFNILIQYQQDLTDYNDSDKCLKTANKADKVLFMYQKLNGERKVSKKMLYELLMSMMNFMKQKDFVQKTMRKRLKSKIELRKEKAINAGKKKAEKYKPYFIRAERLFNANIATYKAIYDDSVAILISKNIDYHNKSLKKSQRALSMYLKSEIKNVSERTVQNWAKTIINNLNTQ